MIVIGLTGSVGAGKTETCKLILPYLTNAGNSSHAADGLDTRILQTNPVRNAHLS